MGHLKQMKIKIHSEFEVLCYVHVGHVSECVLFSPLLLTDVYQRWIPLQISMSAAQLECVCVCVCVCVDT